MGLLDLFARNTDCPLCGERRARKQLLGPVRCPNRDCQNFDSQLAGQRERAIGGQESSPAERPLAGHFQPGVYRIEVSYENFRGEEKTYVGDRRTLRRRNNHLSLCLVPTGQRVAFSRDRIRNLAELEDFLSRQPTPMELRVLNYHSKHRTTSELYESLRTKYPDWSYGEKP